MKRKYWLPGALCLLLGFGVNRFVYGYSFSGLVLLGVGALFLCFGLIHALRNRLPRLMRFLHTALTVLLILGLLAAAVTGFFIVRAGSGEDNVRSDYCIVLGAGVNGTVPSRSLRERLNAAEEFLQAHPDTIAVLSGGQGDHENITEAQCMYNWLTEKGIPTEQLRIEPKATSTEENIRFSLDLIEAETGTRPTECAVLSSSYHLYRASLLAEREGLHILGVASEVNHYFYVNMLLREICAVWYTWIF